MSSAKLPIAKFRLSQIVATPNALVHLSQDEITEAICRHQSGDWGKVDSRDWKANDRALQQGGRLLSRYATPRNIVFWLITEADRSATTVLLPEDY